MFTKLRSGARITVGLAIGLALLVSQAQATQYYIRSDGNNNNNGLTNSSGGAWQTLAKANSTLLAGDRVNVVSMAPADTQSVANPISPANNGTPSGWITYTGNVGGAASGWAGFGITYISLTKQYISIRGFRSRGGVTLDYINITNQANHDSISWCHAVTLAIHGSHSPVIYGCEFTHAGSGTNSLEIMCENGITGPDKVNCTCCVNSVISASMDGIIRKCVFQSDALANTAKMFYNHYSWNFTLDSCQFTGVFNGGTGDGPAGWYLYNAHNLLVRDTKMTLEATLSGGASWKAFSFRDSTERMVMLRDTIYAGVNSDPAYRIGGRWANSGNPCQDGAVANNVVRSCVIKLTGSVGSDGSTEIVRNMVMDSTVLVVQGDQALCWLNGSTGCTFAFNTIGGGSHGSPQNGVMVQFSSGSGGLTNNNRFDSNVVLVDSMAADTTYPADYQRGITWYENSGAGNHFDSNLYFARSSMMNPNRVKYWCVAGLGLPTPWTGGEVGNPANGACRDNAIECYSTYADPKITNTTFANFNAHLLSNSPADQAWHGTWHNGSDHVGAYRFQTTAAPPDSAIITSCVATLIGPDGSTGLLYRIDVSWYRPAPTAGQSAITSISVAGSADGTQPVAGNFANYLAQSFGPAPPLVGQSCSFYRQDAPTFVHDIFVTLKMTNAAGTSVYSSVRP